MDKHKFKKEISELGHNLILLKFKKSSIDLNKMLCEQKPFHEKGGLGFSENDKNSSKSQDKSIVFVKEGNEPKITDSDALTDASTHQKYE